MDCQKPNIAEKLVPFVEGALAEADRREVSEHLPQCQLCSQEVRALRQVVGLLRNTAGRNLNYYPPNQITPGDVIDYALHSDQMSDSSRRRIQLQLVESLQAQQEVEWLRELDQELTHKEELIRVPPMPAELRSVIQEVYGGAAPAISRWSMPAFLSGFSILFGKIGSRPLAGGLLGVVFAGFAVHAAFYRSRPSEPPKVAVAVVSSVQATPSASPFGSPSVTPSATDGHREVALFSEKVVPEDLTRLSRQLWDKKISHTYRDGQIYVAPEDREEALLAFNTNEEKMMAHHVLKAEKVDAGAVPGFAQSTADNHYAPAKRAAAPPPAPVVPTRTAPPAAAQPERRLAAQAAVTQKARRPESPAAVARPAHHQDAPVVAHRSPSLPASSLAPQNKGGQTKVAISHSSPTKTREHETVGGKREANHSPVVTIATPRERSRVDRPAAPHREVASADKSPANKPASPDYFAPRQQQSVPVQARVEPAPQVRKSLPPSTLGEQMRPEGAVDHPARTKEPARADIFKKLDKDAKPPLPREVAVVPGTVASNAVSEPARKVQPSAPVPTDVVLPAEKSKPKTVHALVPRPRVPNQQDSTVAGGSLEGLRPVPKWSERSQHKEKSTVGSLRTEKRNSAIGDEEQQQNGSQSEFARVERASSGLAAGAPAQQSSATKQATQGVVSAGVLTSGAAGTAEVAMLTQAKKLVLESVGEAEVLFERRDDGSLMVTVKPQRALNQTETESLRKILRKKLKLDDADSVVIRQP